ncbi:MAG TPA: hypothetical protein VJ886_03540 [Roseovarius sp.]|nr:hypothetical protein [Roseovarius sp.]
MKRPRSHRVAFRAALALALMVQPSWAQEDVNFQTAAGLHFDCRADAPDETALPEGDHVTFTWDRRAGGGELLWPNGHRAILRQLNNDARWLVHFWYGDETGRIVPEGEMNIGCCIQSYLSVRHSGHFALTKHSIVQGGMRARSIEGRCAITAIPE